MSVPDYNIISGIIIQFIAGSPSVESKISDRFIFVFQSLSCSLVDWDNSLVVVVRLAWHIRGVRFNSSKGVIQKTPDICRASFFVYYLICDYWILEKNTLNLGWDVECCTILTSTVRWKGAHESLEGNFLQRITQAPTVVIQAKPSSHKNCSVVANKQFPA